MCAASPARNRRPCCIGSTTKLRIGVTPFSTIGPRSPSRRSVEPRAQLLPDPLVGPVVEVLVGLALEVEAAERRASACCGARSRARGARRSAPRSTARLGEDPEPGERILALVHRSARPPGCDGAADAVEAVAAGDDVAAQLVLGAAVAKRIAGRSDSISCERDVARPRTRSAPPASRARRIRSLTTSCWPYTVIAAAAGQLGEVDPVAAAAEAQLDAVVHEPFALHPLADAGSFSRSTVPCSSTPARTRCST